MWLRVLLCTLGVAAQVDIAEHAYADSQRAVVQSMRFNEPRCAYRRRTRAVLFSVSEWLTREWRSTPGIFFAVTNIWDGQFCSACFMLHA